MALRTNSKKARENVRDYITKCAEDWATENDISLEFPKLAKAIIDDCKRVEWSQPARWGFNLFKAFEYWVQGLPACNLGEHYLGYGESKRIICELLEETEAEADRFSDEQADEFLTRLIFNELMRA